MTHKADSKLELNRSHMLEMKKYTAQQLRYIVNRMAFPEETCAACATNAGYAEAHSSVRCAELNRKPHVRQLMARKASLSTSIEPGAKDMSIEQLIAWHAGIVHHPEASVKEQQASAIELARLKGYHKTAGEQPVYMNFMDELIAWKSKLECKSPPN